MSGNLNLKEVWFSFQLYENCLHKIFYTIENIASYRVNTNIGYISLLGWDSGLGITPRFSMISSDGKELFVANEDSDTIQFFDLNEIMEVYNFLAKQ